MKICQIPNFNMSFQKKNQKAEIQSPIFQFGKFSRELVHKKGIVPIILTNVKF